MATYSVGTTGYQPHNPFAIKNLTLPDASISNAGTVSSVSAAGPFITQAGLMSRGESMVVKRQDGSFVTYRIDAERSTPGNIILIPV